MLFSNSTYFLSEADKVELKKLVSVLEISSGTTIIFAIAPESSPQHPVVRQLKESLATSDENFKFDNFYYSENSFHNFLYSLDDNQQLHPETGRKLVMAFGIDQLPTPRLVKEMKQLNLGREDLFGKNLVIIFWVNRSVFLDEFRQRAPDFWDWREKMVEFETGNDLLYPYLDWLIAENSYLKMSGVMQINRQVDIFLDQIYVSLQAQWRQQVTDANERSQIEIEMAISQVVQSSRLKEMGSADWDEPCYYEPLPEEAVSVSSTKIVSQNVDLCEAVRENCYSVILGAPGAGKTTLLRYLALHFAMAKRDNLETVIVDDNGVDHYVDRDKTKDDSVNNLGKDKKQKELGKTLLPIFFRIADYVEKFKKQPELTLLEYLRQYYRQWEAHFQAQGEMRSEVVEWLLYAMRQGQCLMMLDGLDEIFDQESCKRIVECINQFIDEFPHNKFVITSRIAGYHDVQLSSRFAEFTIEDMDSEQVERFMYRWCQTVEKAQQPDASEEQWLIKGLEQAQDILQAIEDNPGVQRLTANPLLLTVLALIHRNGDRLPSRRVKLYELAVQTLTEDWQLSRKLPNAPKVVLKETEVVELLAPLAYWMHEEKPSGMVMQEEVEEKLAINLAELNDTKPESESVRQAVGEFLRKVRETTGLFVERMPGVYGFMHLTFEEYFVSRYIANIDDFSEQLNLINSHLHEPRWDEPILLALGYLSTLFSKRANKLVDRLFNSLDEYKPVIQNDDIKIKYDSSKDAILCFSVVNNDLKYFYQESTLVLKNLMFAGQVLNQVELQGSIRSRLIEKLVITYLGLPELNGNEIENSISNQLIKIFRKIEDFTQKSEVLDCLKKLGNDPLIPEWKRMKILLAYLHIACNKSGAGAINLIVEITDNLNPFNFGFVVLTCNNLGEELTVVLERSRETGAIKLANQQYLNFMIALSYIRENHYEQAIYLLKEQKNNFVDKKLEVFIIWALAICYSDKNESEQAVNYYKQAYDQLKSYPEPYALCCFWQWWSNVYLTDGKYKQALDYCQNSLKAAQRLKWSNGEEFLVNYMVRIYIKWKNYEPAIEYLQNRYEVHHKSSQNQEAANNLYTMAICYRKWAKYEQAVEHQNQCLAIHRQLNDQADVANDYRHLGYIYQSWIKYEQAINSYQQSREIYQQLGEDKDVANTLYMLSVCYREWHKYEQALKYQEKCLAMYRNLDDKINIASNYQHLGRIYKEWGKYEQAINYLQQSRELYQKLGRDKDVANQLNSLAICYREWGKYEQAVEYENQNLAICQQLDSQINIANTYFQLGRIYKEWGKYEQAINYYQQSRKLYQKLGRDKDVANQLNSLAICYREWGKYEQAVEYENQNLAICQQLDSQINIANTYFQLGRIYKEWGKYQQAINYYQQSRELYQKLGLDKDVANQLNSLAICYREWGKYEQAIEYENENLAIYQQLDSQINIANTYFQLGRIYQEWGKYEQAIKYLQQSRELYQQLGREQNVANQWNNLAICYIEWGKYEQAVEYLEQNREYYQNLGRDKDVANLWNILAICYREWGKYEQAVKYLQQNREFYQNLGREQNVANQWNNLAICYREWGKYEQAVKYLQQSRELYQKLGRDKDVANLWNSSAICYREWGKYEQAVEYENENLAICQLLDDQINIANAYFQLGKIYTEWGKYEQAVEYLQQSCELYQKLSRDKDVANQWNSLAICYVEWGKYEQAVKYLQQSRELYQKLCRDKDVANLWNSSAICYREWGKYEKAVEYANENLSICQLLDDQVNTANAQLQLGRIYRKWGKYEQAIDYYQQSRELYQKLGRDKDVANLWNSLAICYREWGKYEQAVEYENENLSICQLLDDQVNTANAQLQLGRIYRKWGKYEQAINYYQQSRELYQKLDRDKDVAKLWDSLAICYQEWGKYEQAIKYLQQSRELYQQLGIDLEPGGSVGFFAGTVEKGE